MRTEAKIALTLVLVGGLAGCKAGVDAHATEQQARLEGERIGQPKAAETIFAQGSAHPSATETPTPFATPTPNLLSEPTPTPQIINIEREVLDSIFLSNPDNIVSEYPAWVNAAGNESTGESFTNVQKFKDYLAERRARDQETIRKLDLAYAQISQPVNPEKFKQRNLNFGR